MTGPIIEVKIIRGARFTKEIDIDWGDGATTKITARNGVLHGKDGENYRILPGSEHRKVCDQIIAEQGYSFKKR